jgi:hypothetical protein
MHVGLEFSRILINMFEKEDLESFLYQLNYLKVQDKRKIERKLYFAAGVAVGLAASLLLTSWY